jgi:hypothetical protein
MIPILKFVNRNETGCVLPIDDMHPFVSNSILPDVVFEGMNCIVWLLDNGAKS